MSAARSENVASDLMLIANEWPDIGKYETCVTRCLSSSSNNAVCGILTDVPNMELVCSSPDKNTIKLIRFYNT
jgi:hypothetical protein